MTVATEDHLLVTWPMLESGPIVHQREVTAIPVGQGGGMGKDGSPVAIMDTKQIVTSCSLGNLHFVSAATKSYSGRQLFGECGTNQCNPFLTLITGQNYVIRALDVCASIPIICVPADIYYADPQRALICCRNRTNRRNFHCQLVDDQGGRPACFL